MNDTDQRYLFNRMKREMEMARRANDTAVATPHLEMAKRYGERLGSRGRLIPVNEDVGAGA